MFILKPYQAKKTSKINYYTSDFLAFLFAKFLITLSKSSCLAILDSILNLATSTSRVYDI